MISSKNQLAILDQLVRLQTQVEELVEFFQRDVDFNKKVYPYWSVKDVLGHLIFWHESFARNLSDLVEGKKPNLLKGKLSAVNAASVESTKTESIERLLERLAVAQSIISKFIPNESITEIPYKKGSRSYSRLEHLQVVESHIKKHLKDLKKVYQV